MCQQDSVSVLLHERSLQIVKCIKIVNDCSMHFIQNCQMNNLLILKFNYHRRVIQKNLHYHNFAVFE